MRTTKQVIVGVQLVKKKEKKKRIDGIVIHWGKVWGQFWKANFLRCCTEIIR